MNGIDRPALGRVARLGTYFDARAERFLSENLFDDVVEDDDPFDLGSNTVELVMSDNIGEKFHQLGIEADLQVSVLSGLVKLSGSGSYLNEERKSAKAASMSLVYKVMTVREEISPSQKKFKDKVNTDILGQAPGLGATHVLVGIDWGAQGTITCQDENEDGEDMTNVNGALSAELEKIKGCLDVGGKAKADYESKDKSTNRKFSYYSKCDIYDKSGDLPVTYEEAVEQAKKLPVNLAEFNKGKGVPITFSMMPVENLMKLFKVQTSVNVIYRTLREDSVHQCIHAVESATAIKQEIYDLKTELNNNKDCIPDKTLKGVNEMYRKFSVDEKTFKEDLQVILKKARSSELETSAVDALVAKYEQGLLDQNDLRQFDTWKNKISLVRELTNLGITYIGRTGNIDTMQDGNVFVLYATNNNSEESKNNQFFFRKLQKTYKDDPSYKFIWFDTVLRSEEENRNKILRFINGQQTSKDLYEDNGQDSVSGRLKKSQWGPAVKRAKRAEEEGKRADVARERERTEEREKEFEQKQAAMNHVHEVGQAVSALNYRVKFQLTIENNTIHHLEIADFTPSGGYISPAPKSVSPKGSGSMGGHKTGNTATGAEGTVAWKIGMTGKMVVVMYSLPYSHDFYSNWCGVGIFNVQDIGEERFAEFFDTMYKSMETTFRRKDFWNNLDDVSYTGDNFRVTANMGWEHNTHVKVSLDEIESQE